MSIPDYYPELQITKGNKDNSKIIFLVSHRKHVVTVVTHRLGSSTGSGPDVSTGN